MRSTIYADPHNGIEVLLIEGRGISMGVVYDPRLTTPPVPWTSTCPHCRAGRSQVKSMHVRREIKMLTSRARSPRGPQYLVPTIGRPLLLTLREGRREPIEICSPPKKRSPRRVAPMTLARALRRHRSPILRRCLRFLCSGRPASPAEVAAILRPLRDAPPTRREPGGRRLACKEIDWHAAIEKGGPR